MAIKKPDKKLPGLILEWVSKYKEINFPTQY
jgi:hypothetical protein